MSLFIQNICINLQNAIIHQIPGDTPVTIIREYHNGVGEVSSLVARKYLWQRTGIWLISPSVAFCGAKEELPTLFR
jgi:hypothetical protein